MTAEYEDSLKKSVYEAADRLLEGMRDAMDNIEKVCPGLSEDDRIKVLEATVAKVGDDMKRIYGEYGDMIRKEASSLKKEDADRILRASKGAAE